MPSFTPTQGRYLSFILAYTEGFGLPPAESEIADALKVSPPSANQMMKILEKKGLIRRQAGVARSIEILADRSEIPKWTGKRLTRTVTGWVRTKPRAKKTELARQSGSGQTVYQFKISLSGIKPPIWRRIETLGMPLARFHEAIQTAMGWTNSHLHVFEVDRTRYTDPRMLDDVFPDPSEESYAGMSISHLIKRHGPKLRLTYLYDFGDGWEHKVTLEKTTNRQQDVQYPRCLAGKRCCPPEDVGGIYGYESFLEAIGNPEHEEYDDFSDWAGEFDAEAFDLDATTEAMRAGLPSY
jgi:hypothetical protein